MRLPRVRFTIRQLMIAVAIAGVMLGCEAARRRRNAFLAMTAYHANEERRMRLLLSGGWIHETDPAGKRQKVQIGRDDLERETVRLRMWRHAVLSARFERAARYPWLSVESEPPSAE